MTNSSNVCVIKKKILENVFKNLAGAVNNIALFSEGKKMDFCHPHEFIFQVYILTVG